MSNSSSNPALQMITMQTALIQFIKAGVQLFSIASSSELDFSVMPSMELKKSELNEVAMLGAFLQAAEPIMKWAQGRYYGISFRDAITEDGIATAILHREMLRTVCPTHEYLEGMEHLIQVVELKKVIAQYESAKQVNDVRKMQQIVCDIGAYGDADTLRKRGVDWAAMQNETVQYLQARTERLETYSHNFKVADLKGDITGMQDAIDALSKEHLTGEDKVDLEKMTRRLGQCKKDLAQSSPSTSTALLGDPQKLLEEALGHIKEGQYYQARQTVDQLVALKPDPQVINLSDLFNQLATLALNKGLITETGGNEPLNEVPQAPNGSEKKNDDPHQTAPLIMSQDVLERMQAEEERMLVPAGDDSSMGKVFPDPQS